MALPEHGQVELHTYDREKSFEAPDAQTIFLLIMPSIFVFIFFFDLCDYRGGAFSCLCPCVVKSFAAVVGFVFFGEELDVFP